MKKTAFLKSVGAGVILALLQTVSVSLADTVYDNSTTDLNIRFNPETREVGDEIILGGGARILTDFTFSIGGRTFLGMMSRPGFAFITTTVRWHRPVSWAMKSGSLARFSSTVIGSTSPRRIGQP